MKLTANNVRRLRNNHPALHRQIYVNWGGSGPSSKEVVAEVERNLRWEAKVGPFHPDALDRSHALLSALRASAAGLLGARESEIALADNTTAGINIAAAGIDWNAGDEAVVSDLEHPGGYLPWLVWRDRRGVKVRLLRTGGSDDELLANLRALVGPRTRAVCVSHVAWLTGRRLPLAEIGAICREAGAPLAVDGAQSVGQIAVDVKKTRADVYTLSGQKWLMGPQGTGATYVGGARGKALLESTAGYRSAKRKRLKTLTFVPVSGAGRFEVSTINPALFSGLDAAIGACRRIGPPEIEQRVLRLADLLLEALRDCKGVEVLTPPGKAQSGLVSFRLPGRDAEEVVAHLLQKHRIVVRTVPAEPPGIRTSIHYLNTEEEVNQIGRAVSELAAGIHLRRR